MFLPRYRSSREIIRMNRKSRVEADRGSRCTGDVYINFDEKP